MDRLRILVGSLVVLALLAVAWRKASHALASDEERIRARIADMVDGFHDTDLGDVLTVFHDDYRDSDSGYDRRAVRDALRTLFFQGYGADSATYTVELPPAELDVRVDEEAGEATVALRAVFHRTRRRRESTVWWDARAVLAWSRSGGRWKIVGSSDVNHRDRPR